MDNLDKLDFLYKEIAHAESLLKPQDTGHISTAISYMRKRVREVQEEIRSTQFKNPVKRFDHNPPHQGIV